MLAVFGGGLSGAGTFASIQIVVGAVQAYNGAGATRQSSGDSRDTEGSDIAQDDEGSQDDQRSSELPPVGGIPSTGLTRLN